MHTLHNTYSKQNSKINRPAQKKDKGTPTKEPSSPQPFFCGVDVIQQRTTTNSKCIEIEGIKTNENKTHKQ